MENNKTTFFIMTQKGFEVLRVVINQVGSTAIDKVICSRDQNLRNDFYDDIKILCEAERITFIDRKEATSVTSKYAIAISWRWLIQLESTKLIVLHDSLLPRYRGFAPLVNALINGESEVGVTAIFSTSEFDKGDIIAIQSIPINYPVKIQEIIERISHLYANIVVEIIHCINKNLPIAAIKQEEDQASYSLWLNDDDYYVDWNRDAQYIRRFIDAVGYPYKGACTSDGHAAYRIWDVDVEPDLKIENRQVGKVLFIKDNCPVVVCKTGLLRINKLTLSNDESALPLKKIRTRFLSK
jgi:methionyl-tRNA formyltransferase